MRSSSYDCDTPEFCSAYRLRSCNRLFARPEFACSKRGQDRSSKGTPRVANAPVSGPIHSADQSQQFVAARFAHPGGESLPVGAGCHCPFARKQYRHRSAALWTVAGARSAAVRRRRRSSAKLFQSSRAVGHYLYLVPFQTEKSLQCLSRIVIVHNDQDSIG